MTKLWDDEGFSLTEIMIVVAIIAILAIIAIPKFWNFAYKSKMSEATSNIATIRTALFGYIAANDIFMECGPSPPDPAGTDGIARPWVEALNSFGEKGFEEIGFQPDGAVRYQYEVPIATTKRFVVIARADLDNDGVQCVFTLDNAALRYSKPVRAPANEY